MSKSFFTKLAAGSFLLSMSITSNATVINFDDFTAPGLFADQTPLAEEYAGLGVHFSGSGEVLNSSSSFGVGLSLPFSSPNFLAFNSSANASPPETISFDYEINSFSLDFAGSIGLIALSAFSGGNFVDNVFLYSSTATDWSNISLTLAETFDSVVFDVIDVDNTFVVDNLTFTGAIRSVSEPSSVLLFGMGLIGLAGSRRLKKR
ncbi:hypothetical protein A9Q81_16325 [Gammaproteobacteria bacterium 42_54_T18]|nr:hypothetical protein A9Q81_16325 [Gammaproteobacteria bacterium 42_54_T18]